MNVYSLERKNYWNFLYLIRVPSEKKKLILKFFILCQEPDIKSIKPILTVFKQLQNFEKRERLFIPLWTENSRMEFYFRII